MTTIDKAYDPSSIEKKCYQDWENNGYFKASGDGEPFCIMLPPPNVTGSLHMGHGFGFTLIDILIRYQRMSGKNTLWQGGTDHAGIATQMVVERKLLAQNTTRHDIGREKFVEKIWEWKEESGGNISRQLRRLGASIDWDLERFTMDDHLSQAVREVFIQLYNEGIIYRGTRLVNWDPVLLTAISDLEVLNDEVEGHLWHIRYPVKNSDEHITIATTRPETLLGDVAVAVHPDDKRYQHLIGKEVELPLTDRCIPVIADDYVDPEFGTGCLKITPAHDFNDYEVGKRHQLEPINILTPDAKINEHAPKAYQGLDRFVAREQIIQDLTALGLLEKTEKHQLKIPRGDRSNSVIEPYLTKQWYVKASELAKPAIEAVEKGEVRFIPENWNKTYFQWMNNLEDWCISRQLWWGHRIPVWYDADGKIYVGQSEVDVRHRYNLDKDLTLQQDEDVLDTWFSSALWPFSSLGWPEKTPDFETFFPTSTLVTGFDIIFFWVARMMMMSFKFTGKAPFKDIYITGLIRDAEGHKMSKTKGNVLDPIDLIDGIELDALVEKRQYGMMQPEKAKKIAKATRQEFPEGIPSYGTDALRFTFCSLAGFTRDIRFDTNRLAGYRNFCNKLWNASRYVLMNTEEQDCGITGGNTEYSLADKWIQSRLQQMLTEAQTHLNNYRFDLFAHCLYEFTWNEFCDWYLELSKPILYDKNSSPAILRGTRHTLVSVLETLLRSLHPITPFITEALWLRIAPLADKKGESVMLQSYPKADDSKIDKAALADIEWLKNIIVSIRTIRSEMNISPAKTLPLILRKGNATDKSNLEKHQGFLATLAKIESFTWIADDTAPPASASAFAGDLEMYIPMAGFINPAEETARLNKAISKLDKEHIMLEKKLGNPGFVNNAPADVVAKEKEKLAGIQNELGKLKKQLESVAALS